MSPRRPRAPALCRSWLFVPGADEAAHRAAARSGADVVILELEDFTPPRLRARARTLAAAAFARWRDAGALAAVRVNPLAGDGRDDLAAVIPASPDIVLLPKVAEPAQIAELERAVVALEQRHRLKRDAIALAPNIESARGIMQCYAIARASARNVAIVGSTEDLAADLGAERAPDGVELAYARARLHLEARAAGVASIDCPFTFAGGAALVREARNARRLGYAGKTAVRPEHVAVINRIFTPSADELRRARATVAAFEAARAAGRAGARLGNRLVEMPVYLNAQRLLERGRALGVRGA